MPPKLSLDLLEAVQTDLLRTVGRDVGDPTMVSTDALVTLKMDTNFTVTAVSLTLPDMNSDKRDALEAAVLDAVNAAIREVTRRNTELLTESIDRLSG
jgi:DNA-binding protein YbaB